MPAPCDRPSPELPPPAGRIFLLSPAHIGGERGVLLLSRGARSSLARRLGEAPGVPLGEVFSFLSGLYFRGKLAYARAFGVALPPLPVHAGVLVITPSRGLVPADAPVTLADLRAFSAVDIAANSPRYRLPLEATATALRDALSSACEIVLLGSVATNKYTDVLLGIFGERLLFPRDFVGRGDMSRGALLLRSARARVELPYAPVAGASLHGVRAPRIADMVIDPDVKTSGSRAGDAVLAGPRRRASGRAPRPRDRRRLLPPAGRPATR